MLFEEFLDRKNILKIAKKANLLLGKFDLKQVIDGYKIELEHGTKNPKTDITHDNPTKTLKIALAHLYEDPNYYIKLKSIHKE